MHATDTTRSAAIEPAPSDHARFDRYLQHDRQRAAYVDWQLAAFRPYLGRRILEIGCGVGGIIAHLGSRELICGIDVVPEILAHARQRFANRPDCEFQYLDFAECTAAELDSLQARRFDTIVCMNVLEHFRDDILALRRMESVLAPGGTLALLVPAHLWLFGRYDLLDGHFRRYTKAYLNVILQQTSLRLLRMHYFNAIGALGWWIKYKLRHRSMHGAGQFRLMSRLSPVLRRIEAVVKPPFGLSVIAVLQKPLADATK